MVLREGGRACPLIPQHDLHVGEPRRRLLLLLLLLIALCFLLLDLFLLRLLDGGGIFCRRLALTLILSATDSDVAGVDGGDNKVQVLILLVYLRLVVLLFLLVQRELIRFQHHRLGLLLRQGGDRAIVVEAAQRHGVRLLTSRMRQRQRGL